MQVHEASDEEFAKLTILSIGYRAQCTAVGCRNLARTILRYADRGGRPSSNLERCNQQTREALERDRRARLTDSQGLMMQ
jgi:hypothetical protein